jgi:hypothetical protein
LVKKLAALVIKEIALCERSTPFHKQCLRREKQGVKGKMPKATIDQINAMLNEIKNILDDYSQFMLEIDNTRFNEKENKKFNILEYANKLALQNEKFFPHFLTLERFVTDEEYFAEFRNLINLSGQIQDKLWDMTSKSAVITRKDVMTA